MIDPFEIHRRLPGHQQRLAAEKKVNCYFIPGVDAQGEPHYAYAVCSAVLHESFIENLQVGIIPDYAVVVAAGHGAPDDDVKQRMCEFYGFDDTEV